MLPNRVGWWRADLGTSTTTNGANLATWSDQFGLRGDFSSSAATTKPTYQTNIFNSTLPGIQMHGSLSFMKSPTDSAWGLTGGFSFTFVMKFIATTSNNCYASKGLEDHGWDILDGAGVSSPKNVITAVRTGNHTSPSTTSLFADGTAFCMQNELSSGGTLAWYANGNSMGTASSIPMPDTSTYDVWIGTRPDNITITSGYIGEIIVCSAPIAGADLSSLKGYISSRYAIAMA